MSRNQNKSKKVILQIRTYENLEVGIKRILIQLHQNAARLILSKSRIHLSVHEVRTHIKKIRGILRLIRDEIGTEQYTTLNNYYRELGFKVAPVRDDTSQIELLLNMGRKIKSEKLKKSINKSVKKIRDKRKTNFIDFYSNHTEKEVHKMFMEQIHVIENLDMKGDPATVIKKSLRRIYIRAQSAMQASFETRTNEDYHNWRKQTKYLTYHLMLLRKAWPAYFKSYSDEMTKLSSILGDIHDLFLFRQELKNGVLSGLSKSDKEVMFRKIYSMQKLLFRRSENIGGIIFDESGHQFSKRLYCLWVKHQGFR